jgi:hypothetical protein
MKLFYIILNFFIDQLGNVHKAIEYYKEAINCDAGFKIGYKNISVAYNDLGKLNLSDKDSHFHNCSRRCSIHFHFHCY